MSQNRRLFIGVTVLVLMVALVMGVESFRRQQAVSEQSQMPPGMPTAAPGSIPIYLDDQLVGAFTPADLDQLPEASFNDAEQGTLQEGWMLADVLQLYVAEDALLPETEVLVRSKHRGKMATLSWAEIAAPENMVMFDLSGRGTLKLVSLLPQLDARAEWVQDSDEIRITTAK